jgi:acyl-coenzyme A synthetase/AMP-(fatty) acid ligase
MGAAHIVPMIGVLTELVEGRPLTALISGPLNGSGPLAYAAATILGGGAIYKHDVFDPEAFVQALPNATFALITASMARAIRATEGLKIDRGHGCTIILGGEYSDAGLVAWCRENLAERVAVGYGTTEHGTISVLDPEDPAIDTVGTLRTRVDIDHETTVLRARVPGGSILTTTGDFASISASGHLRILGRADSLFSVGGLLVSPAEIEERLLMTAGVTAALVVPREDPLLGVVPQAYVVGSATDDEITEYLGRFLQPAKIPRTITHVESLPTTSAGKMVRPIPS